MKNFNYIKWVTNNKHGLLTEQTATTGSATGSVMVTFTGSAITCYACEAGQIVSNNNTFTGSYDSSNGIVFGYCGSTSTGSVMTAWYDSSTNPQLSNCGSNTSASAGSGSASTGSGFLSGSADTGSSGTTTTGMGGALPTNLKDPCKEFKTIYPNINAAKTFCKKCETNSSNPMCKCCKGLRENNTQNKTKTEGLRNYNTMKRRKNQLTKGQLRNIIKESIREVLLEQNWGGESCNGFVYLNDPEYPGCMKCQSNQAAGITNPGYQPNVMWGNPAPHQPIGGDTVGPNCQCCRPENRTTSELDCENNEWVHGNNDAAGECWVCRDVGQNCVKLNQIPMAATTALAAGLTLYNDDIQCNAQSDCGGGRGGKCDPTDGTYYGFNGGSQGDDHNDRWGLGCWFCKEDNMPGCTEIVSPMLQGEAFAAYMAGTSSIHGTDTGCNAIEKCGDDNGGATEQCQCCTKGGAVSMAQQVVPGNCASLNNTATGTYNCQPSPPFGGTIKCKKPGTGIPTNPNVFDKKAPNVGDIKRAVRESIKKLNSTKGKLTEAGYKCKCMNGKAFTKPHEGCTKANCPSCCQGKGGMDPEGSGPMKTTQTNDKGGKGNQMKKR